MRKREQIMLERIVYVGKSPVGNALFFCDMALENTMVPGNARYAIYIDIKGEEFSASYRKEELSSPKVPDLPKRFVAILKMIAFPETL